MRSKFIAALVALATLTVPALGQGVGGISPKAFGAKSWRENGLAPESLPTVGNTVWDVRLASDLRLYAWNGSAWVDLTSAGSAGPEGPEGPPGSAATLTVGSTLTGEPGSDASVTNSGSSGAAVLDFVIPRGDAGPQGDPGADGSPGLAGAPGASATVVVGSTTTGAAGSSAAVSNSGTASAAVLEFTIPKGDTGATGATGPSGATGAQGPAGPVAGTDQQVVFNDGGSAAGDTGFTFQKATDSLTLGGHLAIPGGSYITLGTANGNSRIKDIGGSGGVHLRTGDDLYFQTFGAAGIRSFTYDGNLRIRLNADTSRLDLGSGTCLTWNSAANIGGSEDTSLCRGASGIVEASGLKTAKLVTSSQAVTVPDDGNGATRATSTLTPTTSYLRVTCSDSNGCDLAVSETGATDGQVLRLVCLSANSCGFSDTAGVTDLAGAIDLGQYDSLTLLYVTDRWVELARSNV